MTQNGMLADFKLDVTINKKKGRGDKKNASGYDLQAICKVILMKIFGELKTM